MEFVFLSSYSSLLESKLLGIDVTTNLSKATYIVNNEKLLIGNACLLVDLPFEYAFSTSMGIKSRFPIGCDNYKLESFNINYVEKYPTTNIILNKYMLNNLKDLNFVKSNNFLLGLDTEVNGYLTAVGYKIIN